MQMSIMYKHSWLLDFVTFSLDETCVTHYKTGLMRNDFLF